MAVNDIVWVEKKSTMGTITSYTHTYIKEGADFQSLLDAGTVGVDRWNVYDPFGEGGAEPVRTMQLRCRWLFGADVGREEFSAVWNIPASGSSQWFRNPRDWSPVIRLEGDDSEGRRLVKHVYPFNAGTISWVFYEPYYRAAQLPFWVTRAQWYLQHIGYERDATNRGTYVIYSRKHNTWAPVDFALLLPFDSHQTRRRWEYAG
jgi:hypothetical protein